MTTSFTIPERLEERLHTVLPAGQSVSQFALGAFEEKITRAEARSERARRENLMKDARELRPVVEEILKQLGVIS